ARADGLRATAESRARFALSYRGPSVRSAAATGAGLMPRGTRGSVGAGAHQPLRGPAADREGTSGALKDTMSPPEQDPEASAPAVAWSVALRGAVRGRSLAQTTTAALLVGSTLFMVNLYSQVREGLFTWVLATRIALTFLVPWFNATMGIAIGVRKPG